MAVNVKLSEELVAEAKRRGRIEHRSLPKQIEYWSRMGKIAEENPDLPFSLIRDILQAREEDASDEYFKEEATAVLAAMGLSVSDAFRIMMTRIAREKALPFEPLLPNEQTIEAMKEARRGKLPAFDSIDSLMADLDEED